jgi:transcriptional regulator with XRE-family HTH domain
MVNSLQIRAEKLGDVIRDARLATEKSEQECAQAMGVTLETYQQYEQGASAPSLPELEVLAYYLDIPIEPCLGRGELSLVSKEYVVVDQLGNLLPLRQRIIGVLLRKSRLEADITIDELARVTEIEPEALQSYETGTTPVPLPELEIMALALSLSVRDFQDKSGPVGKWAIHKKAAEDFLELPLEMQEFISKPINLPYLELAQRLSEMSVDRLRAVAEGLLEITL